MPKRSADPLTRFMSKVEQTDACWLWTASRNKLGYGRFRLNGETHLAHRIGYTLMNGPIPDGMSLDHVCHTAACVRPDHLRPVTHAQNLQNRRGPQRNNRSSGIRGVVWNRRSGKWIARASLQGKIHTAGTFDNLAEAEAAAINLRARLFTHSEADRRATT